MSESFHFQSIILHLQQFWAEQGCIIWQPYYTQVGAGTYNPATFLRVLGPEPWHVAYVEPSIRPDDGRYGENPNRLQQHYQFQVILKPDPGNPQELYLRSLQAIGIDPHKHDIRFVEDNWESPALGAWGLGWEVWLDGQEITQFTYFQQAGGILVDPVAVEMTYGLERIAMPLQGVRNFKDIRWSPERTYGDVNLQGEREHSRYYFEAADVERVRKMYDLFEAEAISALENGLVLPAHDYVLKCSHTFNILDSRGAVGITERQALFGRMRDLSRRVAEAYRVQREGMGFPWIKETPILHPAVTPSVKPGEHTLPTEPANLLFEVGTEELPVADLASALEQLKERLPALLEEQRLEHGSVKVLGTPRRLTVLVEEVAPRQPDREVVVKGPPAARAFDGEGKPTPAGIGFARGKGLEPSDLQMREMDGGQYAVAVIQEKGSTAMEILSEALPLLIAGLKFEKTMRWNASGVAFSRPIRWILALLGGKVIPFAYAGLVAGNQTRGLRFHDPEEMQVGDATSYLKALAAQGILLDPTERKEAIREGVAQAMKAAGGTPQVEEALLEEVTELVEAPAIFSGTFDPTYLRLPAEVLVSVMKKHQRYFPVQDAKGELLPCFIGVRNGNGQNLESVAEGNAQVILARFADADFFIKEDLQHKLEEYLPRLATLTFQFKLGSMLDKSKRIESLVEKLAPRLGLTEAETKTAERAAHLCKADLATHMVIEMTSLQGSMGKYYALQSGETPEVAQAIAEHYLPRGASKPGLVVGLADRLDSLCGLFAAGLAPTGTKDPFAQRRGALAILQSLTTAKLDFNLRAGLEEAAALQPIPVTAEAINACLEFINGRLQAWLLEQDWRYDVVAAVLPAQGINPARAVQAVEELSTWVKRPDWEKILAAYARCVRITRDQKESFTLDPHVFTDPAEKALFDALLKVEATPQRAGSMNVTLNAFLPAIPAINQFFDSVMVMVEDEIVRKNRLALLQRIAALAEGIADFSQLEGF